MRYRCTFPQRYGVGTPGHRDATARQGHYTTAETPGEAADAVRRRVAKGDGSGDSLDLLVDAQEWEGR